MDLAAYLPSTVAALQELQDDSGLQMPEEEIELIGLRIPKFLQLHSVDEGAARYARKLAQRVVKLRAGWYLAIRTKF